MSKPWALCKPETYYEICTEFGLAISNKREAVILVYNYDGTFLVLEKHEC